jgi:hypothetical protein
MVSATVLSPAMDSPSTDFRATNANIRHSRRRVLALLSAPTIGSFASEISSPEQPTTIVTPVAERMPDDGGMSRSLKSYDHRLRELVRRTGDLSFYAVPTAAAEGS